MTIDEAIKHANGVADSMEAIEWCECAADHRQLAYWLTELKARTSEDKRVRIGKWVKDTNDGYATPKGASIYICGRCGGSAHLFGGLEYQKRKMICDGCGRINIYPWETAFEQASSLWDDEHRACGRRMKNDL